VLSGLFFLLAIENAIRLAKGQTHKDTALLHGGSLSDRRGADPGPGPLSFQPVAATVVELVVILFNRITAIVRKPGIRTVLLNVFLILIIVVLAVFVFSSDMLLGGTIKTDEAAFTESPEAPGVTEPADQAEAADDPYSFASGDVFLAIYLLLIILWRSILHVVGISVTQMKLHILMDIVRETYVLETLLGLVLMIIVCSTVFSTLEEGMPRYVDALWYCFALVTTIGFGDITASTSIGRLLSVFLGIYGIVVVAIITSVIVNFYGEMRRMTGQKPEAEKKQPEEDE
jgi:hypothetical protein